MIFEAVEVDADGREVAPYPTSNAVPMSGDEDGWVDYGNDRDSQQTVLNFGLKKKDPKQLIQEKLALLKQRAQKEADQGRTVDTTRDGAQLSSSSMSYSNTATESERIVDDLFRQFKTSQGNQQVRSVEFRSI
ncbi:hypothetical protein EB796_010336 [Bugula neritina]|uniref:Uncharacterized protein n=1 Tax=Bugula neritina TaxID=10212 RepID=A0A7J7JZN1_BUGNE|nr:hypothetical protein EB796_010336 [Bugula neritina]